MWTKAEIDTMKREMMAELRSTSRFAVQDFRNKYVPKTTADERDLRLAVWSCMEKLRKDEGIDFGPMRNFPECYERKDWRQTANRARKQRARSHRASVRAEMKMRIAATHAPEQDKEQLGEEADRIALRRAMRGEKT